MTVEDLVLSPETIETPFTYFDRLRDEQPVYFSASVNAFIVTRYADCQYVLQNPQVFSSVPSDSRELMANFATAYLPIYAEAGVPPFIPTLVTTDGTIHRRYRAAVDKSFNPSSVRALEPKIRELIDTLIDEFIGDGRVDIYDRFCMRLPLFVICDMLGIPRDTVPLLRRSADAMVRLSGGAAETEESRIRLHRDQAEFHQFLLPLLAEKRAHPDDTLISKLIHTPTNDGTLLNDAELIGMITTLNVGGNETTTNGLGNMFFLCFKDAGLQQRLRADRKLIDHFVEEALRLEAPVAAMPRWVRTDAEIGGVAIPAGSALHVNFASANRDPRHYGCPANIEFDRPGIRNHLAFGMGPHYCLGAMLSRAELGIAMNRILDRLDDIRIDETAAPLHHQLKIAVRAFTALPIRFERRQ